MDAARAPLLVVLAAGASQRLGQPKALVNLGGQSALQRLLVAGRDLGHAPALVISGADHEPIRGALEASSADGHAAQLVENRAWASGRTSSVVMAARRHPDRDLCLAPVDCPLVGPAVFRALADAWRGAGAPPLGWLAPALHASRNETARFGHPVVVGHGLLRTLLAGEPAEVAATPLRALRRQARPLLSVSVEDPAILDDLDDAGDLASLRARLADPPSEEG